MQFLSLEKHLPPWLISPNVTCPLYTDWASSVQINLSGLTILLLKSVFIGSTCYQIGSLFKSRVQEAAVDNSDAIVLAHVEETSILTRLHRKWVGQTKSTRVQKYCLLCINMCISYAQLVIHQFNLNLCLLQCLTNLI